MNFDKQASNSLLNFDKMLLSEEHLIKNSYPSMKDFAKGFMLLPPATKDALPIASIFCEFAKTSLGLEVIKVTVVDDCLAVVMNHYVKPRGEVVDYLTKIHGIGPWMMTEAIEFSRMQEYLKYWCDQQTILVGHNLDCDLQGLKLVHTRCIDTNVLYNRTPGQESSLRQLAYIILKKKIKEASDYPKATMELTLLLQSQQRSLNQKETRRSFGSKQELITRVHTTLLAKYQDRLVMPLTTCLRGKDTIRIHCKKWEQLMQIERSLAEVEKIKPFHQVCLPVSMKTRSQKKGFFVYLKFCSEEDVTLIMNYFKETNGLYKVIYFFR